MIRSQLWSAAELRPTATARRLHLAWWQWPNALSIDAALIAAAWYTLFCAEFSQSWQWGGAAVLALSTWLVYTADHWLDAVQQPSAVQLPARHELFRRNRLGWFSVWLILLLVNIVIAVFTLDAGQWQRGCGLLLAILLYVASVHSLRLRVPKEWIVSAVFTGAPFLLMQALPAGDFHFFACFGLLWALVAANCFLLNRWERSAFDQRHDEEAGPMISAAFPVMIAGGFLIAVLSGFSPAAIALFATALGGFCLCRLSARFKLRYEVRHSGLDLAYLLGVGAGLLLLLL